MRKTAVVVLTAVVFSVIPSAALAVNLNPFRGRPLAQDNMFPESNEIPDLTRAGKILTYRNEKFQEYYGSSGNRYLQYGMINLVVGEYLWGGKDRRITIELATMDTPTAAAGLYHYHRGKVVGEKGRNVDVGAEGIVDEGRGSRNLYFHKANIFAKILYGGAEPVPDLLPVARAVDSRIRGDTDEKPDGFAYIKIEGVNEDTIELTPGFTFNMTFLPPAVWASAPGGGSVASDLFIITRPTNKEAAELYTGYASYLRMSAEYHEEYKRGGMKFIKAVDPNQGRVVFTSYRNVFIIAARPDGYERGEALIDRVIDKIDEVSPGKGPARRSADDDDEPAERRRFNPFRRK